MNELGELMLKAEMKIDILERALNAFKKETGLTVEVLRKNFNAFDKRWDGEVIIATPDLEHEILYQVEIKRRVTRTAIGPLAFQFDQTENMGLLVAEYVPALMALRLKTQGIQFIDACGNAYINALPFYIFINGNKQNINDRRKVVGPRAFGAKGLRVVFALLCNPGFEKMPFREIAMTTGVALGTVDAVFKNLKDNGYLLDKGRFGRKLLHKENLLQRWVTGYPEVMRPKMLIGRYTAKDKYWWQGVALPELFFWGGEIAAAKITGYLKPEIITVYTHNTPTRLIFQNKLRKDPNGEVEVLKAFWRKGYNWYQGDMVHPLIIYADLLATGDARNLETAKMIYNNELYRFIKKD